MDAAHIFAIVPVELALSRDLTLEEIRVLIALLSFRGKNTDVVWPKRQALAERCAYSPKKISETTTSLVKKGWLEKLGSGGRSTPCQYRIHVPETVPDSGTVPESETVSHSGTKTVPDSGTKTVPQKGTRIEQTKEQTNEQTNIGARTRSPPRFDPLKLPIPDTVPLDLWTDLVSHRREIAKPMTERAAKIMAKKLGAMATRGVDIRAAIEQTITARWTDVYEPKHQPKSSGVTNWHDPNW